MPFLRFDWIHAIVICTVLKMSLLYLDHATIIWVFFKYAITIWIVLWIIIFILKEHCQYICTMFTFVVSSVYIWYSFAILYCMLSVPVWHRHNQSLTRIKLPVFIFLSLVWIVSFKYVSVINSCAGEVCLLLLDFGFWFRCFGALQKTEAMAAAEAQRKTCSF